MNEPPIDIDALYNIDFHYAEIGPAFSFFTYPTSLADEFDLPPDDHAIRLLQMLVDNGISAGIWTNSPVNGVMFFACLPDDVCKLFATLQRLEEQGVIVPDFLGIKTRFLMSLAGNDT